MFQKGHKFGKGRPKGSKNIATLEKEDRRKIFEKVISQVWENQIIKKLPPSYIADQFLGKAPDIIGLDPDLKKLLEKANRIISDEPPKGK